MKIIESPQYGPMFRFNDADIYRTLYYLSSGKRIGRKKLSEMVGIGEGSMRRILKTLTDWEMVEIHQTGITIKRSGLGFLDEVPVKVVSDIDFGDMVVGDFSKAIIVFGVSEKIENGMQQRDAGIKVGSNGCTTVLLRNGALMVPPDWNLDEKNPKLAAKIRKETGITEKDAIIIGGGHTEQIAENAALTAAFELF